MDNADNPYTLASRKKKHQSPIIYLQGTYNDPYMSYPELQQQHHENKLCHHKRAASHEGSKNNNLQPYRNFSNMLTNENILKR